MVQFWGERLFTARYEAQRAVRCKDWLLTQQMSMLTLDPSYMCIILQIYSLAL